MIDGLDEEVEVESDSEWDTAADEAVTAAASLFSPLNDDEAQLLNSLRAYADRMSAKGDSKLQALLLSKRWLQSENSAVSPLPLIYGETQRGS